MGATWQREDRKAISGCGRLPIGCQWLNWPRTQNANHALWVASLMRFMTLPGRMMGNLLQLLAKNGLERVLDYGWWTRIYSWKGSV